jgi:hypothetical protein
VLTSPHIKGQIQVKGVCEQGAEENIWMGNFKVTYFDVIKARNVLPA